MPFAAGPGSRLATLDRAPSPADIPQGGLLPGEVRGWMIENETLFASAVLLARLLGCEPAQVAARMRVPRREGQMVCVTDGGWVPAHDSRVFYRDFLDALMAHLGREYHMACRTAAAFHGFSHQPLLWEAQVYCHPRLRRRVFGKTLVDFATRSRIGSYPTERLRFITQFGVPVWVNVPTPEVTLWDCVADRARGGGWDNIATTAADMLFAFGRPHICPEKIAETAVLYPVPVRQRMGFILDEMSAHMRVPFDTDMLRATLPAAPRMLTLNGIPRNVPPGWVPPKFRLCRRLRLRVVDELDPDV